MTTTAVEPTAAAAAASNCSRVVSKNDDKVADDLSKTNKKGRNEAETRRKIHISQVPSTMTESAVEQLLIDALQSANAVEQVSLVHPQDDEGEEEKDGDEKDGHEKEKKKKDNLPVSDSDTFIFGFVTMASAELQQKALALKFLSLSVGSTNDRTPKGKKDKILIRPYHEDIQAGICFKWSQFRCPYGEKCQFRHEGAGGCVEIDPATAGNKLQNKKKRCNAFKKGKCKLGENCPFSHEFDPSALHPPRSDTETPKSDKDCITWKTKGICKRNEKGKCPYRHDPDVAKALEQKNRQQKRKLQDGNTQEGPSTARREKHPLWVRVFGMSYETTELQIRDFFQTCGTVSQVDFPVWEDSGRSKGYCGVRFPSPKAVEKAVQLDGSELHGRWLRIQAGRMYLKQWQEREEERKTTKYSQSSATAETKNVTDKNVVEANNTSRRSAKRNRRLEHVE